MRSTGNKFSCLCKRLQRDFTTRLQASVSIGQKLLLFFRSQKVVIAWHNDYRTGDESGLAPCQTNTGLASERCDYATAAGTLTYAPGERQKIIRLVLVDDASVEGPEQLSIKLSNPQGGSLGQKDKAAITIADNDAQAAAQNPLADPTFFIRQHYVDFLGREPEPQGLQGWLNILNNCGTSVQQPCDRAEVSSAFFRSEEFQTRGYFIYRFYAASLGRVPKYSEFIPDMARVSGFLSPQELESAKASFVQEFMAWDEFKNKYDPTAYVHLLEQTAGISLPNKQALIAGLLNGTETRATMLRKSSRAVRWPASSSTRPSSSKLTSAT
jgi:hypothetical protein